MLLKASILNLTSDPHCGTMVTVASGDAATETSASTGAPSLSFPYPPSSSPVPFFFFFWPNTHNLQPL